VCECRVLCRYYMHGSCRYGKDCQFLHDMGEMPSMVEITRTLAAVSCLVMSKSRLQALYFIYRSANTTWLGIAHMETSADMTIRDLTGLKLPKQSSKLSSCCSSSRLGQCVELGISSTSFACGHAAFVCWFCVLCPSLLPELSC